MKKCKSCKLYKESDLFYACTGNRDGLTGKCKECIKEYNRCNHYKTEGSYDKTYKGVVRVLYKTMKRHQKQRPHLENELPFTKTEFLEWLENNDFKEKYDSWVDSEYDTNMKPSVDRLDDFKGYSFDNMRLITWRENRQHQANDIMNGTGTSGVRCCSIGKYDEEGNLIDTYTSYSEVRREEGYCVHTIVRHNKPCKNGFIWKKL